MTPKEELKYLLDSSDGLSIAACDLLSRFLGSKPHSSDAVHLWAILDKEGTPATISGAQLFVYLRHYFCAMMYRGNKSEVKRPLSECDLAFLVAVAAYGFYNGCAKFDEACATNDLNALLTLRINEQQFRNLFSSPETSFGIQSILTNAIKFRSIWDAHQSAFVGFISPELTSQLLKLQGVGSFLFRFDGTGGISVVVLEAEAGIVSHPLDFDMISSPLSLISLIQRSTRLKAFARIGESTALPKAQILPLLKSSAGVREVLVEEEVRRQNDASTAISQLISLQDRADAAMTQASMLLSMDFGELSCARFGIVDSELMNITLALDDVNVQTTEARVFRKDLINEIISLSERLDKRKDAFIAATTPSPATPPNAAQSEAEGEVKDSNTKKRKKESDDTTELLRQLLAQQLSKKNKSGDGNADDSDDDDDALSFKAIFQLKKIVPL